MFDPRNALDVAMPICDAAYTVMDGTPALPIAFTVTGVIKAGAIPRSPHPLVAAMTRDTNILGLYGRHGPTLFVGFRGTETPAEWLQDFTVLPARAGTFGHVADGFLDVYQLIRATMLDALRTQVTTDILITGHSLGGVLGMLAALDVTVFLGVEPSVITFAAPRFALNKYATIFNQHIETCWCVSNFLDIVPHVPPPPYLHVGAHVPINSGGPVDFVHRHTLPAYAAGLAKLLA